MLHSEMIPLHIYIPKFGGYIYLFFYYYDTCYMGYQGMSRYYMNPFLHPYSVSYSPYMTYKRS